MVALLFVTREAQGPVRHEACDRRFAVTRRARDVGLDGRLVRGAGIRAGVTRGALAGRGVVVLVTGATRDSRSVGLEAHGGRVAGHTTHCAVRRVRERDGSWLGRSVADRYRDRHGVTRRELAARVTGRARACGRRLVMTDLAAPGWRERQASVFACGCVAGDAGKLRVAIVREGVGRRGGRAPRRVVKRGGVALLPYSHGPHGGTPQSLRRVEPFG